MTAALKTAFEAAAEYRFLQLLVVPPAPGRSAALAEISRALSFEDGFDPAPLSATSDEDAAIEAFRLTGQAGRVSVCASDYVEDGYADKGPILGDVAGFYRAFGFEPTIPENPDHFGNLFGFLSFLALKRAWAMEERDEEQAAIAEDAERKLTTDHVHPFLARFAERLARFAGEGSAYAPVADYVGRWAARHGFEPARFPESDPPAP